MTTLNDEHYSISNKLADNIIENILDKDEYYEKMKVENNKLKTAYRNAMKEIGDVRARL